MSENPGRPSTFSELLANRPFIISVLYLATYFTGFSCVVGVVLAYLFKSGQTEDWEESHYDYHIRTFWILVASAFASLTGGIAVAALAENVALAVIFALLFMATLILIAARTVLAMINAVRGKAMTNPRTLLL